MKPSLAVIALALLSPVLLAQEIPGAPPPAVQDQSHLPHVVIVSMGGTIASRAADRMNLTNYGGKGVPGVSPADWLHDLPELNNLAHITTVDLRNPPNSSGESFDDTFKAARELNKIAADPAVDGIVVTHGTSTMAEVAFYMNLVVKTDKPIVFVGSQRPWTGISGDGPLNLYDAVRVAASPLARDKGVLHCMNQYINTARDVTKTIGYRVQTFKGVDVGAIGFADPDKVVFYREPMRRHTTSSEFAGANFQSLPPVEIVYSYIGAPGYLIDAAVAHGAKGVVVDGTGPGHLSPSQTQAVKRVQEKGVVVVLTGRVGSGRVQQTPRNTEAKLVTGDNLPPEKARILLQLALTRTHDWQKVQRYFDEY
ncbi:MAG TPA: asparaginase [Terracidiphilus sp.]|jgi:L-asparaginase|nr:asparaginase [Terracidiphilus sp.]